MVDGADPRAFNAHFGKGIVGDGWFSFDRHGVHFIGLVNAALLGASGQGTLGRAQLDWLKADLAGLSASMPVVLMSHFPLWPLCGLGLGHRRCRRGLQPAAPLWLGDRAQRPHPSNPAQGGRSFAVPRGTLHRLSPTRARARGPSPLVVPAAELPAHIGMTSRA
jgi:hypothetical protein